MERSGVVEKRSDEDKQPSPIEPKKYSVFQVTQCFQKWY